MCWKEPFKKKKNLSNNLTITLRISIHLKEAYSQPFSWPGIEKGVSVHVGFIFQGNWTFSRQNRGAGHVVWQALESLVLPTIFWRVALKLIRLLWKVSSILLNPLKFQLPLHSLAFFFFQFEYFTVYQVCCMLRPLQ